MNDPVSSHNTLGALPLRVCTEARACILKHVQGHVREQQYGQGVTGHAGKERTSASLLNNWSNRSRRCISRKCALREATWLLLVTVLVLLQLPIRPVEACLTGAFPNLPRQRPHR